MCGGADGDGVRAEGAGCVRAEGYVCVRAEGVFILGVLLYRWHPLGLLRTAGDC